MIVRCGRCRAELEVAGSGEFVCPACGTRNAVRSPGLELPDLGAPAPPSDPSVTGIRWVRCPSCSYRFALGAVEALSCPSCSTSLRVAGDEVSVSPE